MQSINCEEMFLDTISEQFKSVYHNHPDAVYIFDMDGNYKYCNPAVLRIFGYTPDELLKNPAGLNTVAEDKQRLRNHLERAMRGESQEVEIAVLNKAGNKVYLHVSIVPAVVDGQVVAVHAFSKDISELVRTKNELTKNQLMLSHAQSLARFGTWHFDVSTNHLEWSDSMKLIHGLALDSAPPNLGLYDNLMHPEDRRPPRVLRHLEGRLAADLGTDVEYRIIRQSDKEVRVVSSRWGSLCDGTGEPTQFFGAVQDITERKNVERELTEAQAIAKIGSFTWDIMSNEVRCSDEVRRIYGVAEDINPVQVMMDCIHPDDRERLHNASQGALRQDDGLHDIECRILLKDGDERHVHIHGTTTFNDSGQPIKLFGTVQDITERKKTEELMHQADKLTVVGELAAGVAHEIRNPLTTLKGFIQFMNSHDLTREQQKEYFRIMLDELQQIEFIAGEMLILAKPQSRNIDKRNIVDKLKEVVSLLKSQASLYDVEIFLKSQSENIHVRSESGRLKQVFVNVIKNAIDAMPRGGDLNISIENSENEVVIRFRDTGCGIPPDRVPRLGEPFYTTKEKGTGLGLMVSKKIVRDHAGSLDIESAVGIGTTVVITLPTL